MSFSIDTQMISDVASGQLAYFRRQLAERDAEIAGLRDHRASRTMDKIVSMYMDLKITSKDEIDRRDAEIAELRSEVSRLLAENDRLGREIGRYVRESIEVSPAPVEVKLRGGPLDGTKQYVISGNLSNNRTYGFPTPDGWATYYLSKDFDSDGSTILDFFER